MVIWAFPNAFEYGVRRMNWTRCGVSRWRCSKKIIEKALSRGRSMWATRSSRYSLAPLNLKRARAGRTQRVGGGRRRVCLSGRGRGDSKSRNSLSRRVNAEKPVTIASGEMYPEGGIVERESSARLGADKRSFGIPGNGTYSKISDRRLGADPPKNESGRVGNTGSCSSFDATSKYVSFGNGSCIVK